MRRSHRLASYAAQPGLCKIVPNYDLIELSL
jgi:hypothetical protein